MIKVKINDIIFQIKLTIVLAMLVVMLMAENMIFQIKPIMAPMPPAMKAVPTLFDMKNAMAPTIMKRTTAHGKLVIFSGLILYEENDDLFDEK